MGRRKKEAGAQLYREPQETSGVEQLDVVVPAAHVVHDVECEPVEPVVAESEKSGVLVVAEGKSLITKRGIRGPGQDVTAKELAGDEDQLQALKDKGFLVDE